ASSSGSDARYVLTAAQFPSVTSLTNPATSLSSASTFGSLVGPGLSSFFSGAHALRMADGRRSNWSCLIRSIRDGGSFSFGLPSGPTGTASPLDGRGGGAGGWAVAVRAAASANRADGTSSFLIGVVR